MSDVKTYLRKMPLYQMVQLLRDFCEGNSDMTSYTALDICTVLAEEYPDKPDVDEAFRRFCSRWLP